MKLKLEQGQVWKRGEEYIRIVDLQRLEVGYKSQLNLASRDGTHHRTSKKAFCRLIKGAVLLTAEEVKGALNRGIE
ncbi:MAG: hypothetical protein AB1705_20185 [Verrucomicrobiota bacterium]